MSETMSANLETMIDSGEAAKVVNVPTLGIRAESKETRYDFFKLVKNRMTRPHTIFFTRPIRLFLGFDRPFLFDSFV